MSTQLNPAPPVKRSPGLPLPTTTVAIESLYNDYYSDPREQEWYRIGAVGKAENIRRLCSVVNATTVLDIGAGNGELLQRVNEGGIGRRLCAVEISSSGIEQLRARQKSMPALAEIKQFDGVHIPYPDNSFDLAILSHVIEHVEHPRLLLYEAARVARYLYAEVPLEDRGLRSSLKGDWTLDVTGHINYYTSDTFRRLLQTSRWKPIRTEVCPNTRDAHVFMSGTAGALAYHAKRAALGIAPRTAQRIFCYHFATLSERADRISLSLGEVLPSYVERPANLR